MSRVGASTLSLCLCFFISACSGERETQIPIPLSTGSAKVSPAEQTLHFALWNTGRATIDLSLPKLAKIDEPVDVVLLFDTTNSMSDYIKNAAQAAGDFVQEVTSIAPNARFAVAALADYYPLHTPTEPSSRPWQLLRGFTTDGSQVEQTLKAIRISHGGDGPEAYTTALYETARLPWREKARRIIVLLGDSHNHPVDPGPDGRRGTADDLRMSDALNELNKLKVVVLGIQAGTHSQSTAMFQTLAERTGGHASMLGSSEETAGLVLTAILTSLLPKHNVIPQGSQAPWVKRIESSIANRSGNRKIKLDIAVPDGTASGLYELPLELTLLEENAGSRSAKVNIRLVVGWINHPLTPFLPIAFLIAFALLSMLGALTHRTSLYNVLGSKAFWLDAPPKWLLFLLEILIWLALLMALAGFVLLVSKDYIPSDILRNLGLA